MSPRKAYADKLVAIAKALERENAAAKSNRLERRAASAEAWQEFKIVSRKL